MDERTPSPEDWARLAREVKRRRVQLELTQQQVAAEGGPSVSILTKIETAKKDSYEDMVLARLERALKWEPGSIEAILAGGRQRELPADTSRPSASAGQPSPTLTSLAEADDIGVARILAILEVQRRELAELRRQNEDLGRRDAERQAEMERLTERIRATHDADDARNGRRKGA